MRPELKSSVIIPAFNEGPRIASVVMAARATSDAIVDHEAIVVVDNNSTDNTARAAETAGAIVLRCCEQGKAPAMATGVDFTKQLGLETVTFLDADLVGLRPEHIEDLVWPVVAAEATMTIGYLGERTRFAKNVYKDWGMFCGQRSMPVGVWDQLDPADLVGFRAEGALNALFRNSGRGDEIRRIELEGVRHTGKFEKFGVLRGLARYLHVEASAIRGLSTRSSLGN